ncbi:HPr family phosphocarrier protein [Sinanaerobacter chloroacetimidivorans]|uniref:Phosphocarrier protein HPr n=1 Tax=Sinanaerobacter chloroacetimidivorans TaxID=2818044 RepID=A0A8J7W6G2_9FIRM|nr:HPr family phosphocarrier protein [Sinanaerobacter chloroacetimidivorans]MBR0599795.1 HPr family phosphocarrier protein [Sinanaerobacter chloroacetimidivorans]
MISKDIQIINELGLHARPASLFVTTASKFNSNIKVTFEDKQGDAKSILNVLALAVKKGDKITIHVEGQDEAEAANALLELVESGFNEF